VTERPVREVPRPGPAPLLEIPGWRERFGVSAGITCRGDHPPFDLGLASSRPVAGFFTDWARFGASQPEFRGLVVSRQVHGTGIGWHGAGEGWRLLEGLDGHATGAAGVLMAVTVADCIPVYLVDPVRRLVALLHAGWRGVAGGIVLEGLRLLERHGSRTSDVSMHCGVGICGDCYEVGAEVFAGCGLVPPSSGRGPCDLRSVLRAQGRAAGVEEASTSEFCSRHDSTLFFSHRADPPQAGRMVAYLGLLP
jgi:copper oxidase (laccase) domain-containing protein